MAQVVIDDDGNDVTEYPFLSNDNWKDIIFVQHLAVDRPYKAAFGQQCNSWKKMAIEMSKERDPAGKLVYPCNLNEKSLQARFLEYCKFIKIYNNNVPFRSGCDDEASSNLLEGIEELTNDYDSFNNLKKDNKANIAAKKTEARDSAEVLRLAAIGRLQKKRSKKNNYTSSDVEDDNDNDTNSKNSKKPSPGATKRMMLSSIGELMQTNEAREERLLAKERNRTLKLEMKQQLIEEKIKENEARRQEAAKQQDMMMKLVESLFNTATDKVNTPERQRKNDE